MTKNIQHAILLITSSLFVSGCILPIPHRRLHSQGIEGKVVDAKTASPIYNAKVTSPDGTMVLSSVDSEGQFKIPDQYGWHGAYLIGPISYSMLPHFDMPYPMPSFRVDANGYKPITVKSFKDIHLTNRNDQAIIRLQPK